MTLTSSAFKHNKTMPAKYTCDSEDVNPALNVDGVPSESKSLALIMDDPDAPGDTWIHWTIWNIDPSTKEIRENSLPNGAVEGVTSFGRAGYGGPCPPSGTHRYFFKLYALDTILNLPASAIKTDLESAMSGHTLAQTELIGLYQRK